MKANHLIIGIIKFARLIFSSLKVGCSIKLVFTRRKLDVTGRNEFAEKQEQFCFLFGQVLLYLFSLY
jgi:hypothetical protein